MIVLNFFGAPGAGKSTAAAYVFSQLKMNGINAELVTEYAKDKVWEENQTALKNQAYVFGKQFYRMSRCEDKVDVIVTDSPLPLSIFYNKCERLSETFNNMVMDVFNSYNNINYLVYRNKPYNPVGRYQTEEESNSLFLSISSLLLDRGIEFALISGDKVGYDFVVDDVLKRIKEEN